MRVTFKVFDVQADSYTGKSGVVNQTQITLQDASEGAKLKQFLEYSQPAELPKETPRLVAGQTVVLDITEIPNIFAGRLRVRGNIVSVK